ncbi:ABC transporter permease [Enterococcus sp. LJL128]|uniref:ABC transporter permease n=1 Tax=Enterococcus sp. LJL51 TaxID=3416656 RepID=UPI003CE6F235
MNDLAVTGQSLGWSLLLVGIALGISLNQKLGLGKDIIYSVCRAVVQLIVVGYVLKYIFQTDILILTLVMVLVIIFNAAWNTKQRNPSLQHAFLYSFAAIFLSTSITLGTLIFAGAIKIIPSQLVPISGMIASNSMIAIGLCYKHMHTLFYNQRQQVLEKLSLGADVSLASKNILRESIKVAMQPTVDSAKTVGLVSLPGMMSGLIFAGVDPVHAIKYQIMVTFMLLSTTSIGAIIAGYLSYKEYYNNRKQLRI